MQKRLALGLPTSLGLKTNPSRPTVPMLEGRLQPGTSLKVVPG